MTRLFVNKGMHVFKCNENSAAIIGPAVFPAIVFSSVAAARFSNVPITGFNPIEGVYCYDLRFFYFRVRSDLFELLF